MVSQLVHDRAWILYPSVLASKPQLFILHHTASRRPWAKWMKCLIAYSCSIFHSTGIIQRKDLKQDVDEGKISGYTIHIVAMSGSADLEEKCGA